MRELLCILVATVSSCSLADNSTDLWSRIEPLFKPPAEYEGKYADCRSPLLVNSGERIKNATEWQKRRTEILANWHGMMGQWPPLLTEQHLTVSSQERQENFMRCKVEFNWLPDERTDGYLLIPEGEGAKPAVVTLFYNPEVAVGLTGEPYRDFARQLTRRGFITLSLGTRHASARNEFALYYPSITNATVEPLSMLAYAAANAWHVLSKVDGVDSNRIGVVGHSFGGKWAMFAATLFENFACAAWSDPGVMFGEDRNSINYWEPWYLGYHPAPWRKRGLITAENPAYGTYPKLRAQGMNLHELQSLMAPRPFMVSGGSEDPPSRWLALNHIIDVYQLLGATNRVAMSNRSSHSPDALSMRQICDFFTYFLFDKKEDE